VVPVASLALAGFAGVVTVQKRAGAKQLPVLHRLSLINLLATALGALFFSLIALVMLAAEIRESLVWRVTSLIGLVVTIFFSARSITTGLSNPREVEGRRSISTLLAIDVPLWCVCLAHVWNIASLAAFWPVLLLLAALFGVGCYSFVRLVFGAA
jgi:hypothetical protein